MCKVTRGVSHRQCDAYLTVSTECLNTFNYSCLPSHHQPLRRKICWNPPKSPRSLVEKDNVVSRCSRILELPLPLSNER